MNKQRSPLFHALALLSFAAVGALAGWGVGNAGEKAEAPQEPVPHVRSVGTYRASGAVTRQAPAEDCAHGTSDKAAHECGEAKSEAASCCGE